MDFNSLRYNLQQPYQQKNWKEWLLQLFGQQISIETQAEKIVVQKGNAKTIERFASIALSDDKNIAVLDIKTKANIQIARNRVAIREIAFKLIDQDKYHGLLVFYHSEDEKQPDYRLSFISSLTTIDADGNFISQHTHAKRYSFVLGSNESCTTATLRLLDLKPKVPAFKAFETQKGISLKDITDAFSVEALNNEFFKKYKDIHYKRFWEYIANKTEYAEVLLNTDESEIVKQQKPIRDFVKKILGRIVFLHFLQKKGWMGCPADTEEWKGGDKNFMLNLFSNYPNQDSFYSKCLTVLFFQTLNTDRRKKNDVAPKALIYKSGNAANNSSNNIRIPFLNGGLFDDDQPDTNSFDFPVEYFQDLFNFFSQYNFTIDENSPEEQEVGINPEMLGHIFENLLEENKDKGVFYTPKEIVHYMCQESLIQYLRTHLPECAADDAEATKAIETFIRKDDIGSRTDKKNFIVANAKRIEDILDKVKICDPAIGSGAFPMGMLHEIFKAKTTLDLTLDKAQVKKDIIRNNIYGVDLENGAVDIARLRFWLSLVVDEEVPQPLPNLDYKIMQGNSLLESFDMIDLSKVHTISKTTTIYESQKDIFGNITNPQLKITDNTVLRDNDLQNLIGDFFIETDPIKKAEKKELISQTIHDHIDYNLELWQNALTIQIANAPKLTDPNIKQALKRKIEKLYSDLEALNNTRKRLQDLEKKTAKPYFLWHLLFAKVFDEGGFDIVIANPPYIKERDNAHTFKQVNESEFGKMWHTGKMDYWFYFLHKAIDVSNKKGIITFITSRYWLNSQGAKKLIRRVKEELSFTNFVDIGKLKVFDNVAGHHMIAIYSKNKRASFVYKKIVNDISEIVNEESSTNLKIKQIQNDRVFNSNDEIIIEINDFDYNKEFILDDFYDTSVGVQESPDKISSKNLKEKPHRTINVGDGVFVLTENELKALGLNKKELSVVVPYLDPSQIAKYSISTKDKKYLIYADKEVRDMIAFNPDFKNLKKHLDHYRDYITSSNAPYGLHRSRNKDFFQKEKLIFKNMFVSPEFTIDVNGYYLGFSFSSILRKEENYSLEYLLAILNSNFAEFWFYQNGKMRGAGVDIGVEKLRLFPINQCFEQEKFKAIVEYLLFINNVTNPPINDYSDNASIAPVFEDVANMMVYELYFTQHMQDLEIDVLQFIDTEKHFKPIDNSETANKEANAKIIGDCYKWLQEQDNTIRNRILLSNIKSPDIIKRINASTH